MSPFWCKSTNTLITDSLMSSSIVNLVRSQSHDAPNFFSCSRMMPPCFSFHSQACSKNSSRLRSDLSIPSLANFCTTLASVAIDAWSVPGTQQALKPCILALRMSTSCKVLFNICPICNTPVTFGGGITIVYASLSSGLELK